MTRHVLAAFIAVFAVALLLAWAGVPWWIGAIIAGVIGGTIIAADKRTA